MKIALIQLNVKDPFWSHKEIGALLKQTANADLIVFPECMPFDIAVPIEEAHGILAEISSRCKGAAVIAGGYVIENGVERNAVFLSYDGKVTNRYFKRLPWQEPAIAPGGEPIRFDWSGNSCIPLICADAADNPSPTGTRMMYEAIRLGAGKNVPIVVSTYGALMSQPYWSTALKNWAQGCGAPVVVCAVSGTGDSFTEDGKKGNFGGGGSGVFWPDSRPPIQRKCRGLYLVDTLAGTVKKFPLPK